MPTVDEHRALVGDVQLHWVESGRGEPVILLHGFPEFWYSWRYQIPALADAGYRAVAPDLRGYNASGRPRGVAAYRMRRLVADVLGLMDALGEERGVLVGHDWGGVIAYHVAAAAPERVRRLVIMNAPHPAAMRRELMRPRQLLRSWYVFFFQLPWLPERLLRAHDYERTERLLRRDIRREDVLHETNFVRYAEAQARPGALTAMINYYRALFRDLLRGLLRGLVPGGKARRGSPGVRAPTLVIWGEEDRYLGPHLLDGLEEWVPDLTVERLPGVSHWVQAEAHERVNELLLGFLGGSEEDPSAGG